MNNILKKLKDFQGSTCVTITLKTHRTKPDSLKDESVLKQLIKEVEERLHKELEKRTVWSIMENLNNLTAEIDHNYNMEGLVIFVNEEIAEFTRLPIELENRTIVDQSFATRDLVRAMHLESNYYVLILNRDDARMLEAHNDRFIRELSTPFPIYNDLLKPNSTKEASNATKQGNLTQEFFNRLDKIVQEIMLSEPLPIVIVGEPANFADFMKVVDNSDLYYGNLPKNLSKTSVHEVVKESWDVVQEIIVKRKKEALDGLKKAVSEGKFKSDVTDIWHAIINGKGKTLFVQKGLYQPAVLVEGSIKLLDEVDAHLPGVIDDIIDEMIEVNMKYGGEVVFLNESELKDFQGLALITRY